MLFICLASFYIMHEKTLTNARVNKISAQNDIFKKILRFIVRIFLCVHNTKFYIVFATHVHSQIDFFRCFFQRTFTEKKS